MLLHSVPVHLAKIQLIETRGGAILSRHIIIWKEIAYIEDYYYIVVTSVEQVEGQQSVVDYIAANIEPTFSVITNFGDSPNSLEVSS